MIYHIYRIKEYHCRLSIGLLLIYCNCKKVLQSYSVFTALFLLLGHYTIQYQ